MAWVAVLYRKHKSLGKLIVMGPYRIQACRPETERNNLIIFRQVNMDYIAAES
jgi:hypothetical protein